MSVPVEALRHIKCSDCNKLLSYFPIYLKKNSAENSAICGRCSDLHIQSEEFTRNRTYESLAQFLKFPCSYQSEGCIENLLPAEIPEHEKCCPYRVICCPLECIWQGAPIEFLDHIQELHQDHIMRSGEFEIDILQSYETLNFVVHNEEIFCFKRKFEKEKNILSCLFCCYNSLDSITKYKYEITLQNGSRNLSTKFPPQAADHFLEMNATEIDIDVIKEKLANPSIIIGHAKIFSDEDKSVPLSKNSSDINLDILSELECPVCFDYIIPPIYQCIIGHSICGDCKSKITECPTCKEEIKNTQNFTLQKMAIFITYPCKYSDHGCDFASKPGEIKQHQKFCQFSPQDCPISDYVNCIFKSPAKDLYSHVFSAHHDHILELDTLSEFIYDIYFSEEIRMCYIKEFSKRLFKLHYCYVENCFYWAMQLIGPPEEAKTYKFEIDILDNSSNKKKLFLRNFCAPLSDKSNAFAEEGQYVFLHLTQIRSFITDELTYAIRIVK